MSGIGFVSPMLLAQQPERINGKRDDPETIREAARQFEALLIAQMLRAMREDGAGAGWMGTGDDQSAASLMEFAEEQLAQVLAANGGLGMARMLVDGLESAQGASVSPDD
ncbi:MAG: hypothetical protein ACK5AZ_01670 [Bryobacteraceae bacterium]